MADLGTDSAHKEVGNLEPPASGASKPTYDLHGVWAWYLTHSSRAVWHGKRNVRITVPAGAEFATITFQELGNDTIHEMKVEYRAWEVLGRGRVGNLESWMIETRNGIEDGAGEMRADWRAIWALSSPPGTSDSPGGMDVLSSKPRNIGDIIGTVKEFLSSKAMKVEGIDDLMEVKIDGGRDKQDERDAEMLSAAALKSGPETGIWRAEDDEVEEEDESRRSKCLFM